MVYLTEICRKNTKICSFFVKLERNLYISLFLKGDSLLLFHIHLLIEDIQEKEKIQSWLHHPSLQIFQIKKNEEPIRSNDIVILEIHSLFDWLKIRRLKKQYSDIIIFPLIDQSLIHTSPIAVELQLPSLFIKPLKKNSFYRNIKKILSKYSEQSLDQEINLLESDSIRAIFWRRVLKEEITIEAKMSRAFSLISSNVIPNVVCVIQGFVNSQSCQKTEGWEASAVVQQAFLKAFSEIETEIYYVPFHKHAALLMKIPSKIASPSFWKAGEKAIITAIKSLRENYGIQLYIGVGSIAREILQLKESFENAKIARVSVAKHHLSLRYFDEIPTNISVQKSVDYVCGHYTEDISMNDVAAKINFSPTYFSRLFKKETGHSFVSYLTLVRILRSIKLLRQSDQSIEQIAMEIGFNTPNYFSSTFKKEIGLSPSQYRLTKEILFSHNWEEDDF